MNVEDLGPAEHERLYLAALTGDVWLAHELEALGLSDPEDSLDDAKGLSSMILEAVERARRGM